MNPIWPAYVATTLFAGYAAYAAWQMANIAKDIQNRTEKWK